MVKMGTVWDRTAEFVTDNLTAIVPIALLAFFVPFSIQGNFASVRENAGTELALTLELMSLAFSVLAVWGSLAIIAMALGLAEPQPGAVATRRLPAALLVWIGLFVAVAAIPVIALAAGGAFSGPDALARAADLARNGSDVLALVRSGVILYIALMLLPLLWLGARLIVVTPAIVAEHRLFSAVARSFRLTRGHTLPLIGVILLYVLVTQVAVLATHTVFGSVFRLVAGPADGGLSLTQVLTSVMVAVVETAFAVIGPAFTAKLFLALTQRTAAGIP